MLDAQTGSEDGHGIGSQPAGETDRAGQPHSGARRQPLDAPSAPPRMIVPAARKSDAGGDRFNDCGSDRS